MARKIEQPEYLIGRILAVERLVLALVDLLGERQAFAEEALLALQLKRDAASDRPVPEAYLAAIDDTMDTVRSWITGSGVRKPS
jgi:hypothetical protein